MSKTLFALCGVLTVSSAAFVAAPASAHHSYAMFDEKVTLSVPATVQSWDWTNPHSFLQVIEDSTGKHWALECASPSMLVRNGMTRNTFKPGDKVTVKLHPRRDKTDGGSLQTVTVADGRTLVFEAGRPGGGGGPPGGAPPAARQ